jgi:uncharacterized protein (UPF0548 family)
VRWAYHKLALQYGSAFPWNRLRYRSSPVILLGEPSEACIRRFLEEQRSLPFSYPEVGASRDGAPPGYPTNHRRGRLGTGQETFLRAREALRRWEMYRSGWTKLFWPGAPIAEGVVVVILSRHLGVWSLYACRIACTVEEETPSLRRYGFAFGTLPGHVEQREERFTVEWLGEDDALWYEVFAFARPAHPLARAGRPFVRQVQRRFAVDSFRAMAAAVDAG